MYLYIPFMSLETKETVLSPVWLSLRRIIICTIEIVTWEVTYNYVVPPTFEQLHMIMTELLASYILTYNYFIIRKMVICNFSNDPIYSYMY